MSQVKNRIRRLLAKAEVRRREAWVRRRKAANDAIAERISAKFYPAIAKALQADKPGERTAFGRWYDSPTAALARCVDEARPYTLPAAFPDELVDHLLNGAAPDVALGACKRCGLIVPVVAALPTCPACRGPIGGYRGKRCATWNGT